MSSSDRRRAIWIAVVLALALAVPAARAQGQAQAQAQGFAVERLYLSAPGGGWFVLDDLDIHGGLGGVLALNLGYANNPLVLGGDAQRLAVVSAQALADFGAAITYRRWRVYLTLDTPLAIVGQSGTLGDNAFVAPDVSLASHPDALADARLGLDVRLVGGRGSRFRLGLGGQLLVPFGTRADYDTDGTFRGMVRVLVAGDVRSFTYAGQVGVHIRPLDDTPTPGSPRGSELLFGVAAGVKLQLGARRELALVIGPELFGATALRSFAEASGTALEGLLSVRLEGTRVDRLQLRGKLGAGGGINPQFGAAEWRVVLGFEVFNHNQR
jgi:hypothetical protein